MQWAPDTSDKWAPDPGAPNEWALDSAAGPLTLGTAVEHFLTAKAAEGASPKTIEWYRMVLGRAARDLGPRRPLDALTSTELRTYTQMELGPAALGQMRNVGTERKT